MVTSEEQLQKIMTGISKVKEDYGMRLNINIQKVTKVVKKADKRRFSLEENI